MKENWFFISGSQGKIVEAKYIFPSITAVDLDLDEIQSMDVKEIISHKLDQARAVHPEGNLIVEDTGLYLEALNGFPGPLIKWFILSLGPSGIYELLFKQGNLKAIARSTLGVEHASGKRVFFEGEAKGIIVSPRVTGHGFGWDDILVPEGKNQTLSQMDLDEKLSCSMRGKAFSSFRDYLRTLT